MTGLTGPQTRCLQVLADLTTNHQTARPGEVARTLWPDSTGWTTRSRFHASAARNQGAVGGTMPMKAATVLWRLHARGVATTRGLSNDWYVTDLGQRVLAGTADPRPLSPRQTEPSSVRNPKTPIRKTTCSCMTEDPGDGYGERVVVHSRGCPEHPDHDGDQQ